jgi:lipopolysaccharide cholinephosphotransferase
MKYNKIDIDIRDVQIIQLEILLELDKICKRNNIKYQLFAGTLLGAIRHNGFIPWDDDIDVCMLRSDYEKFIKVCNHDLASSYFLQNYKSDKYSYLQFSKLRKNNTVFANSINENSKMHNGIYIDVFPLDNVKPNTFLGKIHPWLFQFLYILSSSKIKERTLSAKSKYKKYLRLLVYYVLKPIPKKLIDFIAQKVLRVYEKQDTKYINHLTNGVTKVRLKKYIREKASFSSIIDWCFENQMFPIPSNYDDVLIRNFGDYLKLPPKMNRYPHHDIIKISFNKTKDEKIKREE